MGVTEGMTSSRLSDEQVLTQVEEMATKLLEEEDVTMLMEICKQVIVFDFIHSLIRHFTHTV